MPKNNTATFLFIGIMLNVPLKKPVSRIGVASNLSPYYVFTKKAEWRQMNPDAVPCMYKVWPKRIKL